jgi:hypothetical protein
MLNDERSKLKPLKRQTKRLLKEKIQEESSRNKALLILNEILAIVKDCKARGVMPPFGLIEIAQELSKHFHDNKIDQIISEIIQIEKEVVQNISAKTGLSPAYLRDFEKLLASDPYKAAETYFAEERIKKINTVINQIEKGDLPPPEEFTQYLRILEEERDRRDRLAHAIAVQTEILNKQGEKETPRIVQANEYQFKLGKHKLHAAICKKHRNDVEKVHLIMHDVAELNSIIEREVSAADIAIAHDTVIDRFAVDKNLDLLREGITTAKNVIQAEVLAILEEKVRREALRAVGIRLDEQARAEVKEITAIKKVEQEVSQPEVETNAKKI